MQISADTDWSNLDDNIVSSFLLLSSFSLVSISEKSYLQYLVQLNFCVEYCEISCFRKVKEWYIIPQKFRLVTSKFKSFVPVPKNATCSNQNMSILFHFHNPLFSLSELFTTKVWPQFTQTPPAPEECPMPLSLLLPLSSLLSPVSLSWHAITAKRSLYLVSTSITGIEAKSKERGVR